MKENECLTTGDVTPEMVTGTESNLKPYVLAGDGGTTLQNARDETLT